MNGRFIAKSDYNWFLSQHHT